MESIESFKIGILQTQIKDLNTFLILNWVFTTIVLIILVYKVF